MKGNFKKLITDILRDRDLNEDIPLYMDYSMQQYNYYSAVKLSMNYYTLCEMVAEQHDVSDDVSDYFSCIKDILEKIFIGNDDVSLDMLACVDNMRAEIEKKMQVLTSFTDGYEIYEYILNRLEAGIKNKVNENITPEQLSARVFNFVFSENDTVVINSKLQLVMAQLPVRMTKNKFYDIVANTLSIYKGGDKRAVNDFADMLRKTALLYKPEGFDKLYPELFETYELLKNTDYKNINEDMFDMLVKKLSDAAEFIESASTMYILIQEIVNDVYSLLLTNEAKEINLAKPAYKAAIDIVSVCKGTLDTDAAAVDFFVSIEGIQEDIYENITILEASSEDIFTSKKEKIEELGLSDKVKKIKKLQKLVSTSLFAVLDDGEAVEAEEADNAFIMDLRNRLTDEFSKCFSENPMIVNRSIMSKLLSAMPIFLNSQQEIKDYLDYVLCGCSDKSELTACDKLLGELIEEV